MMEYYNEKDDLTFIHEISYKTNNDLLIGIDPTNTYLQSFSKDPYFKVYNRSSESKSTKVARIYFNRAEYANHTHGTKINCHLNREYLNKLISYLTNGGWEELVLRLNNALTLMIGKPYYFNGKMPDYNKLDTDNSFNKEK